MESLLGSLVKYNAIEDFFQRLLKYHVLEDFQEVFQKESSSISSGVQACLWRGMIYNSFVSESESLLNIDADDFHGGRLADFYEVIHLV
ncbi:hypothetical protein YC2023_082540 [Brassica napus]